MRVLLISKRFPPSSGARSLQVGKLVRSLQSREVQLTVLAGVPEDRREEAEQIGAGYESEIFYVPYTVGADRRLPLSRHFRHLRDRITTLCATPRFVKDATVVAARLWSEKKFDLVVSFCTPIESHLIAKAIVAIKPGAKWIASFSDPWPLTLCPYPYRRYHLPVLGHLELRLLRDILNCSAAVHVTNRYAAKAFLDFFGASPGQSYHSIPHIATTCNGSSQAVGGEWDTCRLRLLHLGHIQRERVSAELISAVRDTRRDMPDRFRGLLCIGGVCKEFRNLVRRMKAEDAVEVRGPVSAEIAQVMARHAGANLALEAKMTTSPFLPSKFADYAVAGRPIIAVTPGLSPMRDYLKDFGGGVAVEHCREQIARAIRRFVVEQGEGLDGDILHKGMAREFDAERVGRLYLDMFEKVLNS